MHDILLQAKQRFRCIDLGLGDRHQLSLVEFSPSRIRQPIRVTNKRGISVVKDAHELASAGNFARFYFHELFPDIERVIYLDLDTIVQGDIAELWKTPLEPGHFIAVVPRADPLNPLKLRPIWRGVIWPMAAERLVVVRA